MDEGEVMTYRRVQGLPWQMIDDKAVILDPRNQKVHELNEVGSFIWEKLDGETDPEEICTLLSEDFGGELAVIASDIEEFCEGLVAEGIVEPLNPITPF
jgi:hypothetical protein